MSVKITALEAENVKRIKAVALTPSPTGLTIVGGNNNQGKTSVLDALAWALGGDRFRRLNPDCGFVLLDKLEQMDMTTLQEFSAWLEAEHLQAIATRVSTGSECQIIIEDGMVKDADPTLPPVTEKPQQKSWTKGAF